MRLGCKIVCMLVFCLFFYERKIPRAITAFILVFIFLF